MHEGSFQSQQTQSLIEQSLFPVFSDHLFSHLCSVTAVADAVPAVSLASDNPIARQDSSLLSSCSLRHTNAQIIKSFLRPDFQIPKVILFVTSPLSREFLLPASTDFRCRKCCTQNPEIKECPSSQVKRAEVIGEGQGIDCNPT